MSSEITQNSSQESSRPMWLWLAGALKPVAACEGPQRQLYRRGFTQRPLKIQLPVLSSESTLSPSSTSFKCGLGTCALQVKSSYYRPLNTLPFPPSCGIAWYLSSNSSYQHFSAPGPHPALAKVRLPPARQPCWVKIQSGFLPNKQVQQRQFPAVSGTLLQETVCKSVLRNLEDYSSGGMTLYVMAKFPG